MPTLPLAFSPDSWTWQVIALLLGPVISKLFDMTLARLRHRPDGAFDEERETAPDRVPTAPQVSRTLDPPRPHADETHDVSLRAIREQRREVRAQKKAATRGQSGAMTDADRFLMLGIVVAALLIGAAYLRAPFAVQLVIATSTTFTFERVRRTGRTLTRETGDTAWARQFSFVAAAIAVNVLAAVFLWWQPFGGDAHAFLQAATDISDPTTVFHAAGLGEWLLLGTLGVGVIFVVLTLATTLQTVIGLRLEVRYRRGEPLGSVASRLHRFEQRRAGSPTQALAFVLVFTFIALTACSGGVAALILHFQSNVDTAAPRIVARLTPTAGAATLRVASSETAWARITIRTRGTNRVAVLRTRRTIHVGDNRIHITLPRKYKARRLTISLTARDEAGNDSATQVLQYTPGA